MKKLVAVVLALVLTLGCVSALADVKLGQVDYAAHGTKCFAVLTVAVDGDKIVDALIDEFQFMAEGSVGVPNSDSDFGTSYPEGKVLASKRANAEAYSANMAAAGSTVALDVNYAYIEDFVTGKTIAELETILGENTKESMVDAVSGATLVDTFGYVSGLLEAAKLAK